MQDLPWFLEKNRLGNELEQVSSPEALIYSSPTMAVYAKSSRNAKAIMWLLKTEEGREPISSVCDIANASGSACPDCNINSWGNQTMTRKMKNVETTNDGVATQVTNANGNNKGYVQDLVMYMVSDDLSVTPMSMVSSITVMNKFLVSKLDVLEERVVDVGMNEERVLDILKASFQTEAILTGIFLSRRIGRKGCKNVGANSPCASA
ncbi:hypothetical protein M9H77_28887 [Catharanthus roseus]|uniref:Uncharacterized protein n=1 Tax=Catharanthus roseus TaxID=4058 RepID=A0ACC0AHK4_CATRO|nr:hypothetical protein M9H77_28887 [Catharanthus roseus]